MTAPELTIWARSPGADWGECPLYHNDRAKAEKMVKALKKHRPDREYVIRATGDGRP